MADETKKQLDEIADAVSDITRALSKVKQGIEESTKDTLGWLDATKLVQRAQESTNKAHEVSVNIGRQMLKNAEEKLRLQREVLPGLGKELDILRERQARNNALKASTDALLRGSEEGSLAQIEAQQKLNELIDVGAELESAVSKNRKQSLDILSGIIPALDGANMALRAQGEQAVALYRTEKKRLELAKGIDAMTNSLVGNSKELNKLRELGNALLKGGIGAYFAIVQASLDRWIELDSVAAKFRNTTGLLVSQTRAIDDSVRQINVEMQQFGVGLEEGYAAATALYKQFQVSSLITKSMIADVAQMSANLGISADSSAKIMSRFGTISKATFGSATNMIKGAAALANMAGVAPDDVMRDIAEASNETLTFLAKSPMKLVAATVEARRLGTTINDIAKSSRHMLDFQTSINEELEASALLGRSVNFQTARQLAYEGDIVGARKEALKQIESVGDFTRLNVYQQEALAKAAGMTVDEVLKQQNQQKMLNALKNTDYAKYKAYTDMVAKASADEKEAAKDLAKRGAELADQQMRQGEINKLTNALSSIWVSITDALLPIANTIMPVVLFSVRAISVLFKVVAGVIRGMLAPFDKITSSLRLGGEGSAMMEKAFSSINKFMPKLATGAEIIGGIIGYMVVGLQNAFLAASTLLAVFGKIFKVGGSFKSILSDAMRPAEAVATFFRDIAATLIKFSRGTSIFSKIFGPVAKIAAPLFKIFGVFAKFLGPIGLIINAFQFVSNLMEEWDKFPDGFIGGLQAIGSALYKTLLQPFVDMWNWVSEKLMGKSPSEMGLGIVKGLAAVGGMITDVLFAPFQSAWGLIKKIPFVSKLFGTGDAVAEIQAGAQDASNVSAGAVGEATNVTDLRATVQQLTDAIAKLGTIIAPQPAVAGSSAGVEAKLDELITLMKSGGIAVNMDGKRVSSALAAGD